MKRAELCAIVTVVLLLGASAEVSATPQISKQQIVDLAAGGVGSPYVWGGDCWDPNNRSWKGADCSGFVAKVWQVPSQSDVTSCGSHPYTSSVFAGGSGTHWTSVSRGDAQLTDALAKNGHVAMYSSGDAWGSAEVYEAKGSAYGIVHGMKSITSSYSAIRRNAVTDNGVVPGPEPGPDGTGPAPAPGAEQLQASAISLDIGGLRAGNIGYAACPGQPFTAQITLRNDGAIAWVDNGLPQPGQSVRLGLLAGDPFGAASRVSLNSTGSPQVQPGQQVTFSISGQAATQPGLYAGTWQLTSELVAWFGPTLELVIEVSTNCEQAPPLESNPGTAAPGGAPNPGAGNMAGSVVTGGCAVGGQGSPGGLILVLVLLVVRRCGGQVLVQWRRKCPHTTNRPTTITAHGPASRRSRC